MLTVLTQTSEVVNCMTAENTVSSAGRQHVPIGHPRATMGADRDFAQPLFDRVRALDTHLFFIWYLRGPVFEPMYQLDLRCATDVSSHLCV